MKHNILMIGATSEIAQVVGKIYAAAGANLFLTARNPEKLATVASDLQVRGCGQVFAETLDLTDCDRHSELLARAERALGEIDLIFIAYGTLPSQKACEAAFAQTYQELSVNCFSVISLLTLAANYFERKQQGCIAVITSVAGDRGRQSNYVYGTAKGALSIFLQGLRNRLAKSNVDVVTIKPGFVDTVMTREFKKNWLWSTPQYVGNKIVKAINARESVVYVPGFWRYIMWVIKFIPEKIFCKMSL